MAMWKEEKKKRNARGSVLKGQGYEILGIGFVLLLLGFGILNLASPDREFSETENRMLEQRPDVQLSSVADGRFMKSFETWQTDQFVFRDGWIRLRTAADRMLGKKESGGVFLGEDGGLYEKPEKLGEAAWTSLYAIREFAGRHLELPVYLMLVPDAAGVKPEELPPFAPVEDQERQLEEIGAYLGDAVRQIPVYEALREHRDEYLYYRTDHHWTTLGAWYAYQEAAGAMGLEAAEADGTEPPLYPVSDSFEGTLASVSGYRAEPDTISVYWPDSQPDLVVSYVQEQEESASLYASEKLKTRDQYGMFLNGNHPLVRIRTMAESSRRLLLVKDSYANCFVPYLTSQFQEIVLVDPRYYYGNLESLLEEGFTDVLFLYNLNTFLADDVLHLALEAPQQETQQQEAPQQEAARETGSPTEG